MIANADRPLDAAAAAPLSAGGKPGPLLVTDDPETVPEPLQGFLSDTQPGFVDDPSRALYNHIWLLGDPLALSVAFQAQVDTLTQLARVSAATSGPQFGGEPEKRARRRGRDKTSRSRTTARGTECGPPPPGPPIGSAP